MDPESDAFGQALKAYHDGGRTFEIVERDDEYVGVLKKSDVLR